MKIYEIGGRDPLITIKGKTVKNENLANAEFSRKDLRKMRFKNVDLSNSNFIKACLDDVVFEDCDLSNASFMDASMRDVKIINCKLDYTLFDGTNMAWGEIIASKSDSVTFRAVNMYAIKISNSDFLHCGFTETNMINANIKDSIFRDSSFRIGSMQKSVVENVKITDAYIVSMCMEGSNINNLDIHVGSIMKVDISEGTIKDSNFNDCSIRASSMRYTHIEESSFKHMKMSSILMSGCEISKTKFNAGYWADVDATVASFKSCEMTDLSIERCTFTGSNFHKIKKENVAFDSITIGYYNACPTHGSFIGWKVARGHLIKLLIPKDALRSSATTNKCRASKAKVLEVTRLKDGEKVKGVPSSRDIQFIYKVGKTMEVPDFDKNRWEECSTGIHFFIDKEAAINHVMY